MAMRWRTLAPLLLAVLLAATPALGQDGPMGAIWLNRDAQPAMDLDGDGLYDAVEYITPSNQCILRFRFGNGTVIGYSLGDSAQLELVKIDAADLTSNGVRDLIMMAYDPGIQEFSFHVLRIREDQFRTLPVPSNEKDAAYRFEATLLRGYAVEIKNADESFLQVHKLDAKAYAALYREDGSVRKQTLHISPFQNFSVVPYTAGYALELKQAVSFGSENIILGYVVSSLVWRGGEAYLIGQRFDPV